MKSKLKQLIQHILKNVLGIQIYRVRKEPPADSKPALKMKYVHDPAYSYMVDSALQEKLALELSQIAEGIRNQDYFSTSHAPETSTIVAEFFQIYRNRSLTDNTHGSGFHNAFWIYLLARLLDPELIVESGVWKGHTSWLLLQACPQASLYGFDISLNKLEVKDLPATFLEQDWQDYEFPAFDSDRALVFFDCHINHAQRILEAHDKGFKHLLFDDNPPAHKIFSHIPGIPTAAMLAAGEATAAEEISWVWNGEPVTRSIDTQEASRAQELIKVHQVLPDVGGLTRYGGFAFLTYVQI